MGFKVSGFASSGFNVSGFTSRGFKISGFTSRPSISPSPSGFPPAAALSACSKKIEVHCQDVEAVMVLVKVCQVSYMLGEVSHALHGKRFKGVTIRGVGCGVLGLGFGVRHLWSQQAHDESRSS